MKDRHTTTIRTQLVDRREFMKQGTLGAASIALALSSTGCATTAHRDRRKQPNLVFIYADELRYQSLGYAGCGDVKTPAVDRLASQSVSFQNAITTTPVCGPYRAIMLTGKYPHTTGVITNDIALPDGTETFGTILSSAGYRTGYVGKWHLGKLVPNPERPGRFQHEQYIPPDKRFGFQYWSAFNFNHMHNINRYYEDSPEPIHGEGFQMDSETDRAIEFIRNPALGRPSQTGDAPFALFLAWGPPHPPFNEWNMPAKYMERYGTVEPVDLDSLSDGEKWGWQPWQREQAVRLSPRPLSPARPNARKRDPDGPTDPRSQSSDVFHDRAIAMYYAMVDWMDDCVGRVLDALEESGEADNTIVVFTSDHGVMLGSHNLRGKMIFYEESVRVPMLIRYPGKIPGGSVSDACLGTVDILPTILGLMGLPSPKDVQGQNLAYLALGSPEKIPGGVRVADRPEPDCALISSYTGYTGFRPGWEYRGLRTSQYTYARSLVELRRDYVGWGEDAEYAKDPEIFLFDNVKDPYQMENLAGRAEFADVQAGLERKLVARLKETKDDFRPAEDYRKHFAPNGELIKPIV